MSLSFDYCVTRLLKRPPILSRIDSTAARLTMRRNLVREISKYRDKFPATVIIKNSSEEDRLRLHCELLKSIPYEGPYLDTIKKLNNYSTDQLLDALTHTNTAFDVAEVNQASTEREKGDSEPKNVRFTSKKQHHSMHIRTQWAKHPGSLIVLSADESNAMFGRKLLKALARSELDILQLIEEHGLPSDVIAVFRKVIQLTMVLLAHSTSSSTSKYYSLVPSVRSLDLLTYPPNWIGFLNLFRLTLAMPPKGVAQRADERNEFEDCLVRFCDQFEQIFGTESDLEVEPPSRKLRRDIMGSHWHNERKERGQGPEYIVLAPSYPSVNGTRLPAIKLTTRVLLQLNTPALYQLATTCQIALDEGIILSKLLNRMGNDFEGGPSLKLKLSKYAQCVHGLVHGLMTEAGRRFHESSEPVSTHELALILHTINASNNVTITSGRSSLLPSSTHNSLPESFLETLVRRHVDRQVFEQSSFYYLLSLLTHCVDAPDETKGKFFRFSLSKPLTKEMGISWSFYNCPQYFGYDDMSHPIYMFRRAVLATAVRGWLPVSHLLMHSSFFTSNPEKGSFTLALEKTYEPSPSFGYWVKVLTLMAYRPDRGREAKIAEQFGLLGTPDSLPIPKGTDHLTNLSTWTAYGNALFYAVCFGGTSFFDMKLVYGFYEAYKDQFVDDGLYCVVLVSLLMVGPLSKELSQEVDRMLAFAQLKVRRHLQNLMPQTFCDIYGYIIIILKSHVSRGWFENFEPAMVGNIPANYVKKNFEPRQILRLVRKLTYEGDQAILLVVAMFYQSLDRWPSRKSDVMAYWVKEALDLKAIVSKWYSSDRASEFVDLCCIHKPCHRLYPAQSSIPIELDAYVVRFHRMLHLHDTFKPEHRHHWSAIFRPPIRLRGKNRIVSFLHQASRIAQFKMSLKVGPQAMVPVWITEIAHVNPNEHLYRFLSSWWYLHSSSCTSNQTLFQPNEFVGAEVHKMAALVNIFNRLLRSPEFREKMILDSEATDFKDYVRYEPEDQNSVMLAENESSSIATEITKTPTLSRILQSTKESHDLRSRGKAFLSEDNGDISVSRLEVQKMNWKDFLWVGYCDLSRALLKPGEHCIRTDENTNRLVGERWSPTRESVFFNPETEVSTDQQQAMWHCAYDMISITGAPPPWFTVKKVWNAVVMRLMPTSFLNQLLRSSLVEEKGKTDTIDSIITDGASTTASNVGWEIVMRFGKHFDYKIDMSVTSGGPVRVLGGMGFSPTEQVEFLGCVARAIMSPSCPSVSQRAKKTFIAQAFELSTSLVFSGANGLPLTLQQSDLAEELRDILIVIYSWDSFVQTPAYMLLTQQLGFQVSKIPRELTTQLKSKIGAPFNGFKHTSSELGGDETSKIGGETPSGASAHVVLDEEVSSRPGETTEEPSSKQKQPKNEYAPTKSSTRESPLTHSSLDETIE